MILKFNAYFIKKFRLKSEVNKNTLTLMMWIFFSQAIPIIISPILVKFYTPENFGLFTLYISIVGIISSVACAGYEHAIMLPKEDKNAIYIAFLSFLILSMTSILTLIVVLIFNSQLSRIIGNNDLAMWLYLLPFSVFLTGFFQIINFWNNRKKQYSLLGKSQLIQVSITAVVGLLFGIIEFNNGGLIVSRITGYSIVVFLLCVLVINKELYQLLKIDIKKFLLLGKRYINFLKYSAVSGLLNSMSFHFFPILLSKVFSLSLLGYYSLAMMILVVPQVLIGNTISKVYFQVSMQYIHTKGNNKIVFLQTLKKLFIIALLIYVPMYFYILDFVVFVFGANWQLSGELVQILIPLMFIKFISSTLSVTLTMYEKQKTGLFINLVLLLTVIILFIIASLLTLDKYAFFYIYTSVVGVLYTIYLLSYYYISRGNLSD